MSVSNGQLANASTFNNAFVSKTANSTVSGTITQDKESVLKEIATPATPGSGYGKIYFKSDGKLYQLNDAGIETQVGSGAGGGAGGVNFITNGTAEDNVTTGWAVYADAAGTSPVDGTGGTANVTITTTATTPLAGIYSFLMAKDAVNRQGQGWSYAFTIDSTYQAKVLQISFDYLVSSGTFSAGSSSTNSDVTVWIYDVTNAVLIQPSNIKLFSNNGSITDKFQASFQTASNSSSYRLIFHVTTASASAYTLEVDNISVSPSQYVFGTPVTDWQSYTPTLSAGFGTATNISFFWRRVGSSLQVKGTFVTGTVAASLGTISLPGVSIDTSKISINNTSANAGGEMGAYQQNGAAQYTGAIVTATATSTTVVYFASQRNMATGLIPTNISSVISSGATTSVYFELPIAGWSSSVQTSDSADTRVISCRTTYTTASIPHNSYTTATFSSGNYDTAGMIGANTITIPVSGIYQISAFTTVPTVTNTTAIAFSIDSGSENDLSRILGTGTSAQSISGTDVVKLNAGNVLRLRLFQNSGSAQNMSYYFAVSRISGPSAIAATETIAMRYTDSSGGAIGTSLAVYKFQIKDFDTHSSYSTSTGLYTVPISGKYQIAAAMQTAAISFSVTQAVYFYVYKNGSAYGVLGQTIGNGTSNTWIISGSDTVQCNAGDTISIYIGATVATTANTASTANHISIVRIGN